MPIRAAFFCLACIATAQATDATIHNAPAAPAIDLRPAETVVFRGTAGHGYNHHAQLTSLGGTLFATWSSGLTGEDMPGQRMLLATSDDAGRTWSAPRVLVAPDDPSTGCITAEGLLVRDGALLAFYGSYGYTAYGLRHILDPDTTARKPDAGPRWHRDTHCGILVGTDRGRTWSGPAARLPGIVPNLSPAVLRSGRLLLPGNWSFRFTDDPRGLAGWRTGALPRIARETVDDSEGLWHAMHERGDDRSHLEASVLQLDDGRVRAFFRTNANRLAVAESADAGATWSEPRLTAFRNAGSRHHFGRLPDGRFFALSTPVPGSKRTPLVLALSRDGAAFDRHWILGDAPDTGPREPGRHKGGRYGYPWLHVAADTVHAIYSVHKEDIAHLRFPLARLESR
jgi:hypothetical protein